VDPGGGGEEEVGPAGVACGRSALPHRCPVLRPPHLVHRVNSASTCQPGTARRPSVGLGSVGFQAL